MLFWLVRMMRKERWTGVGDLTYILEGEGRVIQLDAKGYDAMVNRAVLCKANRG